MDSAKTSRININWMRQSFDKAASSYDEASVLQKEMAHRLVSRLDWMNLDVKRILDLGSGTGYVSQLLRARYPKAQIISLDIAPNMLIYARSKQSFWQFLKGKNHAVCADVHKLPFAEDSFDLVISNAMLQWSTDLDLAFQNIRHVLRPEGLLTFTSFGPDTLKELRAAWADADPQGSHVNTFIDMHDVGDAMVRSGLGNPVLDVENFTLTYDSPKALMRDLKALGARHANDERAHGLTGKSRMKAMLQAYESFKMNDGKYPATYEVVYGHAWCFEMKAKKNPMAFEIAPDQIGRL